MQLMEKFSELFNLFTPISGSSGSSARQGLRRLMLLRTITVSIGLPGLLAFQIFSSFIHMVDFNDYDFGRHWLLAT